MTPAITLSPDAIDAAVRYNDARRHSPALWRRIQATTGTDADSIPGPRTAQAVADWQATHGLHPDGKVGPLTLASLEAEWRATAPAPPADGPLLPMTDDAKRALVAATVKYEGGSDPDKAWSATNRDGEYEGRFDKPERGYRHWASKHGPNPTHIGLSWGAWQFTQDGGALGRVLRIAASRDPDLFQATFGGPIPAAKLLTTTEARGSTRVNGRSPRVQPVDGADLWEEPWLARFRHAGTLALFRDAQAQRAVEGYLDPMLSTARAHDLKQEPTIAVLFDIAIQYGVGGARARVDKAMRTLPRGWTEDQALDAIIAQLDAARRPRRERIRAAFNPTRRYDLGDA